MPNCCQDLPMMFGTKRSESTENMYTVQPLIPVDPKTQEGRDRSNRSHYVLVGLSAGERFGDGRVVVIGESIKMTYLSLQKTAFFLIVVVAFLLGFTFGAVVPLYFAPSGISFSTNFEENGFYNNQSVGKNYTPITEVTDNNLLAKKNVNRLFWSERVERSLPLGFGESDDQEWRSFVEKSVIVRLEKGCGRMQNRLVTFEDGTKACCRYRQNTDQIQGEIFSFYLGRLLKLRNLVPSTLAVINSSDHKWASVKREIESSQWVEDHPVVLTKFVDDLVPAHIPPALRTFAGGILTSDADHEISSYNEDALRTFLKKNSKDKTVNIFEWAGGDHDTMEMVQWSDLIIFDYLTANLDRIVNNLYNLQWNPEMLSSPAHNLARTSTDLLVFLDNESGLLHGYRLLEKYEPYHRLLMDSLCIFRKSTVDMLTSLNTLESLATVLNRALPSPDVLPPLPDKNVDILRQRVAKVLGQVVHCAQIYHNLL